MATHEHNTTQSRVKFEKLQLNDENEYIHFLKEAYKDTFNSFCYEDSTQIKKMWRWKYLRYPYIQKKIPHIYICRYDGRIIAQICAMPCSFKLHDRMLETAWLQDLMILAQYRNLGLGYYLIKFMLEQIRSEFQCALVGGTNQNSYLLFKRLGFLELGGIQKFIKPINTKRIAERFVTNLFLNRTLGMLLRVWNRAYDIRNCLDGGGCVVISEEAEFNNEFEQLWTSVSQKIRSTTLRDSLVMRWRWHDHPFHLYKVWTARQGQCLRGYVVVREGEILTSQLKGLKIAIISDLFFDPKEKKIGKALLKNVIKVYRNRADLLRCDLYSPTMTSFLRRSGFIGMKSQQRFLIHALHENYKKHVEKEVTCKTEWHLTYGDSDLDF